VTTPPPSSRAPHESDILTILDNVDRDTCVGWIATSRVRLLARYLALRATREPDLFHDLEAFLVEQAKLELDREEEAAEE